MYRDDDGRGLAPAARRSEQLLSRFVLEGLALSGRLDGENRESVIDVLIGTCHGCGADLEEPGWPPDLLCPRCEHEKVWLLN